MYEGLCCISFYWESSTRHREIVNDGTRALKRTLDGFGSICGRYSHRLHSAVASSSLLHNLRAHRVMMNKVSSTSAVERVYLEAASADRSWTSQLIDNFGLHSTSAQV